MPPAVQPRGLAGLPHYNGRDSLRYLQQEFIIPPGLQPLVQPLPLPGACRVSDTATLLIVARLDAACPVWVRLSFFRHTMSSTQCIESIPQCPRTNPAISAAVPRWLVT